MVCERAQYVATCTDETCVACHVISRVSLQNVIKFTIIVLTCC